MRERSYGQDGLSILDRFGTYLSRKPVLNVIRQYNQPSVLDIGCGHDAPLLRGLAASIKEGTGIDVQISKAARETPQLTFIEKPIDEALSELDASQFDVILMISVLEHLWEPQSVLTTCHKLLSPGGRLVVNVPNWLGKRFLELSAFKLGLSPACEMDDHKMYYSKHDLWPLLVRAGFKPSGITMRYHKFGLNLFAVAADKL
jgi:2-polyprenyl-3-methyl-5-hydroxy-6-metoxy-1,4-benzoquinol methylase